jgi:hypothetical protein
MNQQLVNFLIGLLIELLFFAFLFFGFFYPIYLQKKKDGRVDKSKSFLRNVWDSVLPD